MIDSLVKEGKGNIYKNKFPIDNLAQFLQLVSDLHDRMNPIFSWYRGQSREDYRLLPHTFRENVWETEYDFKKESEIVNEFKRKCQKNLNSDFEYYQLMQHYGFPTRLLDWSESSLVALFFAIQNATPYHNPAVWIIDPLRFNDLLSNDKTTHCEKISHKVKQYIPADENDLIKVPIAVLPSYTDIRIISQKSCFVLFGKEKIALEHIKYEEFNSAISHYPIAKLVINKVKIENIRIELLRAGINYSTVYPDLEGLVKDLKHFMRMK